MRISIRNSAKNTESIYVIKDLYLRDVRGKKSVKNSSGKDRTTVTVTKLGTIPDLMTSMNMSRDEVIAWAREEARRMTEEEKSVEVFLTNYFETENYKIEKYINAKNTLFFAYYSHDNTDIFQKALFFEVRDNGILPLLFFIII